MGDIFGKVNGYLLSGVDLNDYAFYDEEDLHRSVDDVAVFVGGLGVGLGEVVGDGAVDVGCCWWSAEGGAEEEVHDPKCFPDAVSDGGC